MFISDIATRIRTVLARFRGIQELRPPPALRLNPMTPQQVRDKVSDIVVNAGRSDAPISEVLHQVEPYMRALANSAEPRDRILLAVTLMHKACHLENDAADPVGGILATVEALLMLGRMVNDGIDDAVAPYRHYRSWAAEPIRRHVANVLTNEAELRRMREPEVATAEIQSLDLETGR